MYKFIITGPESCGKTTSCLFIAKKLDTTFVSEYARNFLTKLDRKYIQKDLLTIAKQQYSLEKKEVFKNNFMILDTDLLTIKIWSYYKFNSVDKWILNKIDEQKKENRIYLLFKPDIKWVSDPLRENPNNREDIFNLYEEELKKLKLKYYIIEGSKRNSLALKIIKSILKNKI